MPPASFRGGPDAKTAAAPRGRFEAVIDIDRHAYRIKDRSKAVALIMLGSAALFLAIGTGEIVEYTSSGPSYTLTAGIFMLAAGAICAAWPAWLHLWPALVIVEPQRLTSRGAFGRHRHADASEIVSINLRSRRVFYGRVIIEVCVPYVTLRSGRGFWLYGLAGAPSNRPVVQAQADLLHRIRTILNVASRPRAPERPKRRRPTRRR